MTIGEIAQEARAAITPRLKEYGVEAFVLMAYVRDSDGNMCKMILGDSGGNAAYRDALRPLAQVGDAWAKADATPDR